MSKFRQFLDSVQYQQAVSQLKESFAAAQDLITNWAIQGVENTMLKGELKGTPFNELSRHHKLTVLASNVDWERYTKLGMDENTPLKIMFNAIDGKPPEKWLEQTPEEAKSRSAEIDGYSTQTNYIYNLSRNGVDDVYDIWHTPDERWVCSIHFWNEPDTNDAAKALAEAKELVNALNTGKMTETQAVDKYPEPELGESPFTSVDEQTFEQSLTQAASRGRPKEKERGIERE